MKRIRAKNYILEYPTTIPHFTLKEVLNRCFAGKTLGWKYIIKTEYYSDNKASTIVLLEFPHIIDCYTSRLHISVDGIKIEGLYRAVFDKDITLKYILKSVDSINNIDTNKEMTELIPYYRMMRTTNDSSNTTSDYSKQDKNFVQLSTDKEREIRIDEKIKQFEEEYAKKYCSVDLLAKYVTNLNNYYYDKSKLIPETLKQRIRDCQVKLREVRKKR